MRALLLATLAGLIVAAGTSRALAIDISGSWSGFGKAEVASSGKSENFRCRVTYVRQSAKVYAVNAVCANPSTRIVQTGTVLEVRPNTFVGDFHNAQFDVRGRVRVTVNGGRQAVSLSSPEGNGTLSLRRQ